MKNEEKKNIDDTKYIKLGNNNINNSNKDPNINIFYSLNNENNCLKEICSIHNNNIIKYCITCNKCLCVNCETEHSNHSIISKKEIQFDSDEIKNIQKSLKKYTDTYNKLIIEIKLWKTIIEEKINKLENYINNNDIFNFNENITNNDLSLNNIIKYRKIFYFINNKSNNLDKNLKILSLFSPIYDEIVKQKNLIYNKYSLSKLLLKELLRKNDFLLRSIEIIKYLNEINDGNNDINNDSNNITNENSLMSINKNTSIDNQINGNNIFSSNNINTKQLYVNYNIFPKNNENATNILNKNEFNNIIGIKNASKSCDKNKVIEKYIDLKRLSLSNKRKYIEETEIRFNKTYNNKKYNTDNDFYINKNDYNIRNKSKEIKFKQILNNIQIKEYKVSRNINNPINDNKKQLIYSKKNLSSNSSKTLNHINNNNINNLNNKIKIDNIILNSNGFKSNLYDSNIKTVSSITFSNDSLKNDVNKNNNDIEISKFSTENKPLKKIFTNKENLGKTYVHKKFLPNMTINKNEVKLEQSNTEQKYNTNIIKNNNSTEDMGGILFNNIFKEEINKEENKIINFDIYKNKNDNKILNINIQRVKNNINLPNKNYQRISKKPPIITNNIISIKNNMQKKELNINIKKSDKNEKFIINAQKELCIGLELNNFECKMALINQNNNESNTFNNKVDINLISFNDNNNYSIPSLISFDGNNNSIKIGYQAYDMMENNPTHTIFNIIKLIVADYDDIKEVKNYWPFKLYKSEENKKLYIKIGFNGEKEKIFYIEDLLIIYLKKLFKLFFNKIEIDEKSLNIDKNLISNKNLSINLVVTVPNYFSYSQRKIIENIFKQCIFPNHKSINSFLNYNIIMKNFKIENASSISAICYKDILNQNQKNLLIINIDGCSINLSIVNIIEEKNRIFEVKNISYTKFGIEDFIDKFMDDCLSELEYNSKEECINNPNKLAKLRKSYKDAIYSFKNSDNTEINISKLYGIIELKLIMNKKNLENACKDMNDEIISQIKKLIIDTKLNENDIDDIILIGGKYSTLELNNIINEIFKDSIRLQNNIKKNNNYESYLVSGAALQAFNTSDSFPKYFFNDITPISFGIETINNDIDIIIEKGTKIPSSITKKVKIKNNNDDKYLYIKIYEGEYIMEKNNIISCLSIDKDYFINGKKNETFFELLFLFELDDTFNLKVFILDENNIEKKYECVINNNNFLK